MAYCSAKLLASQKLVIQVFFRTVIDTFFKDISIVGKEHFQKVQGNIAYVLYKDGATIVFCNHSNQFVDALILISQITRQIKFIAAAKSMRRPLIGQLSRAFGCIPVERPQDLVTRGTGLILQIDSRSVVHGFETKFRQQLKEGDILIIQGVIVCAYFKFFQFPELTVNKILSDTQIECKSEIPLEQQIDLKKPFKVQPRVDQNSMFESVWQSLRAGDCIGIFPEGGSHDRTDLLPLKAGICIMALGAAQKYNVKVALQPVGLNYFRGHKFRSQVLIEYGVPFFVNEELVATYGRSRREAIAQLLSQIEQVLSAIHLVRSLYIPEGRQLPQAKIQQLTRRFSFGISKYLDNTDIKDLLYKAKIYKYKMNLLGLEDYQVTAQNSQSGLINLGEIFYHSILALLNLGMTFPGFLMNFPIGVILSYLAEKERLKALAGSKVKIQGKDVVASYKIICGLVVVPLSIAAYTLLFFLFAKRQKWGYGRRKYAFTTVFLLLWPIYVSIMIRSGSAFVSHAKKIKAKILFYLYQSKFKKLRLQRDELQQQIREQVNKLGNQIYPDFEEKRIVRFDGHENEFQNEYQEVFNTLEELGI